jgi:glycerophosphoryl diester phosphodiesterase
MISQHLIAHRGWRNRYPENTLPAIEAAILAGARHIEIDIQLTADGIPVLSHDHLLNRLSNSNTNINHCSFSQLQSLSAYEPERFGDRFLSTGFFSLEDCIKLIERHAQITLYVELKRQSIHAFGPNKMLETVMPMLQNIRQRCFLISFDSAILHTAVKQGWQNIAPVLLSYQQAFEADIERLAPPLLFCDNDMLNARQPVAALPYPAAVYEIGDYGQAQAMLMQGAALVETFCIGELIEQDADNNPTGH